MTEELVALRDEGAVAARVADDVAALLRAAQVSGSLASLVLTGGTISRAVHSALATREGVDWGRVELWWGDERFLPLGDLQRNATQAREDLLARVPLRPERVHEVAASDSGVGGVESAASAYDRELRAATWGSDHPWFDVLMLGIGPDGHCASLFPGRPEVHAGDLVLPVTGSPKPPPERVSLGMTALRSAAHVVFVATGEAKAAAVAGSLRGQDVGQVPAAGPRGTVSTRWYVDEAAASAVER